jgi:hypothetical protein
MRQREPDDLRLMPRVGNVIYSSASPSIEETNIRWPDGTLQKVKFKAGEGVMDVQHGPLTCRIFRRGSPEHLIFLEKMQSKTAELARKKAELEEQLNEQFKDDLTVQAQEIGVPATTPLGGAAADLHPPSEGCTKAGPHFDCPLCPDPDSGRAPKHHSKAVALSGHLNSLLHKRNEENRAGGKELAEAGVSA